MRIWLDDVREPPSDWEWFKDADSLITALAPDNPTGYIWWNRITLISLDHDLGTSLSGWDVVKHLEYIHHTQPVSFPFVVKVHSMNPVGREKMIQTLQSMGIYDEY